MKIQHTKFPRFQNTIFRNINEWFNKWKILFFGKLFQFNFKLLPQIDGFQLRWHWLFIRWDSFSSTVFECVFSSDIFETHYSRHFCFYGPRNKDEKPFKRSLAGMICQYKSLIPIVLKLIKRWFVLSEVICVSHLDIVTRHKNDVEVSFATYKISQSSPDCLGPEIFNKVQILKTVWAFFSWWIFS